MNKHYLKGWVRSLPWFYWFMVWLPRLLAVISQVLCAYKPYVFRRSDIRDFLLGISGKNYRMGELSALVIGNVLLFYLNVFKEQILHHKILFFNISWVAFIY